MTYHYNHKPAAEGETIEHLQEVFAAMQLLKRNTVAARRAKSGGRSEHARSLNSNPNILKKRSETMKALWSNPEFREKHSEGMKTFYREHPERSKIRAEVTRAYYKEHPEQRNAFVERMLEARRRRKKQKLLER